MEQLPEERSGGPVLYLPPLYLPPVGYFRAAVAGPVAFSNRCPMVKHSLQARAHIKSPQGILRLTVPTDEASRRGGYAEARIVYHMPWQRDHVRSVQNYYRNAAFFEFYWPELEPIISHPFVFLRELNSALLEKLWHLLGLPAAQAEWPPKETPGPRRWLPEWTLQETGSPPGLEYRPYYQLYGDFIPNLSILDLLFHEGPHARQWLRE